MQAVHLGLVPYREALELQRALVERCKAGVIGDVLLLLEHPPVITLGRNAKTHNVIASPEVLSERGVEIFECDRGGDVTYHGPGQLVGYPIFDLRDFHDERGERKTLWPVEFVRMMEKALIRACGKLGVRCTRAPSLTGVWTKAATPAKIAAIGVHISRGVTSHGFALNVNNNLDAFGLIVPCGISGKSVTSLAHELGTEVLLADVAQIVAGEFASLFHQELKWLSSCDELLAAQPQDVPLTVPRELREIHKEDEVYLA